MWRDRGATYESLGVSNLGSLEHDGSIGVTLFGETEVHVAGRQQTEASVMMLVVVPAKEVTTEAACVLNAAEASRKVRPKNKKNKLQSDGAAMARSGGR